jgi:ATP-dependent Lon protease
MADDVRQVTMLPNPLPLLPIKSTVLFPSLLMPLAVGRRGSLAAVEAALASEDKSLLVTVQNDTSVEDPTFNDLFPYATFSIIKKAERSGETLHLLVQGVQRVRLKEVQQSAPYLQVRAEPAPVVNENNAEVEALHREVVDQITRISELLEGQTPVALVQVIAQVPDILHQVYLVASLLGFDLEKSKNLLACDTYGGALKLVLEYLAHEFQVLEVRQKIASQAHSEISREQREYILRQQLRAIQEELGDTSPEQAEAAELKLRLDEADLPEQVRKEAHNELSRLQRMSPNAADYQLTRTHLDLIVELPWSKTTEDNLDLNHARQILDEDHFDLKEVKTRIIEHLAVMKLNPKAKAPILCFVGPPGVGKTSLGQSIANATA